MSGAPPVQPQSALISEAQTREAANRALDTLLGNNQDYTVRKMRGVFRHLHAEQRTADRPNCSRLSAQGAAHVPAADHARLELAVDDLAGRAKRFHRPLSAYSVHCERLRSGLVERPFQHRHGAVPVSCIQIKRGKGKTPEEKFLGGFSKQRFCS